MVTASKIFNLQSQGHDGSKVMIQEVEYVNSILRSELGAAWNNSTVKNNINPTKFVHRATIKHLMNDPNSHIVFDIPAQVFIIRSKLI